MMRICRNRMCARKRVCMMCERVVGAAAGRKEDNIQLVPVVNILCTHAPLRVRTLFNSLNLDSVSISCSVLYYRGIQRTTCHRCFCGFRLLFCLSSSSLHTQRFQTLTLFHITWVCVWMKVRSVRVFNSPLFFRKDQWDTENSWTFSLFFVTAHNLPCLPLLTTGISVVLRFIGHLHLSLSVPSSPSSTCTLITTSTRTRIRIKNNNGQSKF